MVFCFMRVPTYRARVPFTPNGPEPVRLASPIGVEEGGEVAKA